MKPLMSSLRDKKRYIAFKIDSDEKILKDEFVGALWGETLSFFGEVQASGFNLWVLEYHDSSQEGFLVCRHTELGRVKAALGLVTSANNKKVGVRILGVSGTVKALKRKFLSKEEAFDNKKDKIVFEDEELNVARSTGDLVDAEPKNPHLVERLNGMNRKFIGLTKKDLGR